jgi:hypothetical protein
MQFGSSFLLSERIPIDMFTTSCLAANHTISMLLCILAVEPFALVEA